MSSDVRFPPSGISIESIQQDAKTSLGITITLSGSTDEKITQLRQAIRSVEAEEHNEQEAKNLMLRVRVLAGDKLEKNELERVYGPELQKFIDALEQYAFIHQEITSDLEDTRWDKRGISGVPIEDKKVVITGDLDKDIKTVGAIIDRIGDNSNGWAPSKTRKTHPFARIFLAITQDFSRLQESFEEAAKKASQSQESKTDYKDSKK